MTEPTEYHVMWEIEITAMNPDEAASKALRIQRDQQSGATVFDVIDVADVDKIITRVDAGMKTLNLRK